MADDPDLWRAISGARSSEVWIALTAGVLYVYRKSEHPSRLSRAGEAGISGMLAYSLGPEVAAATDISPALVVILLAAAGYLALDVVTSLIADRAALREILIRRLGGKGKDGDG